MALTDRSIQALKPADKPYKQTDGAGLHLLVTTAGSRLWRYKYRFDGKEKLLALGRYPDMSLRQAREARDGARAALNEGRDPGRQKAAAKERGSTDAGESFEALAREWHAHQTPIWMERHADDVISSLQRLVFPAIGPIHVNEITVPKALEVLRAVEDGSGAETAHRVRQRMSAVFVYAISKGVGQTDPAGIVKGALRPVVKGKMPAVTTLEDARKVIRAVESMATQPATKAAHRFLALTLVRPGEINGARWDELDLNADPPLWSIPAERMKMKEPHTVPLSHQASAVLEAMRPITGRAPFVFPNARSAHKPMSENAMNYLLPRAGFAGVHVPHGWRATFSTIMNERYPTDADVIERILAHAAKDRVRAAYNRAAYLTRRHELLQVWADLLLDGANDATALVSGPRRPRFSRAA